MNILKSLMGNKSLLSGALDMLRGAFLKEGISAVIITPSDDPNSETPGMSIRQYAGKVALLSGDQLEEVERYFELKSVGYVMWPHQWTKRPSEDWTYGDELRESSKDIEEIYAGGGEDHV